MTEKSVRIARICAMFESGSLWTLADRYKKLLPEQSRQRFVAYGSPHAGIWSEWPTGCGMSAPDIVLDKDPALPQETLDYAALFIDRALESGHYVKAELAARYLRLANLCDLVNQSMIDSLKRKQSWPDPQLVGMARTFEIQKLGHLDKIKQRFEGIDQQIANPKPVFRELDDRSLKLY